MKTIDIVMVRVYITEASQLLNKIIDYLKNDDISGLSVFRAIEGVGQSGSLTSSLLDLSLNLPISIEFFDYDKAKIEKALEHLHQIVKPGHIMFWEAKVIVKE